MNIFLGGAVIVSSLIALAVAASVVIRAPLEAMRRWLAALLVFATAWILIVNLQNPELSDTYNLWIIRITFIASLLMLYAMLGFVSSATKIAIPRAGMRALTAALVAGVGLTLTPLTFSGVYDGGNIVVPQREVFYFVILAYILLLIVYSTALALTAYNRARHKYVKRRFGVLASGLLGGVVAGMMTNIILTNALGTVEPARYSWIALLIWTLTLVYVVARHHLLDVRLAVVRTIAYSFVFVSLVGVYFGLAFLLSRFFNVTTGSAVDVAANVAIAVILALVFQPARYFFNHVTRRLFYHGIYKSDDFFARLNRELSTTTDMRLLLRRAAETIGVTLNAEQSFFYVTYQGGERYISAGTAHHSKFVPRDGAMIAEYLAGREEPVVLTEAVEDKMLQKFLDSHRIALVLPLRQANRLLGYLLLGERRSGVYVRRDLRMLMTLADELTIAIQNALSIQEVRELNETLQQRIEDATKELRTSNMKLQKLDQAKDEFVSMASHQLRTPLTSVKGYISMVLEGDAGEITPMQQKLLSEAFASSERMVHLINDFLNVSRLQTGKFMLDARPIDLAKIVGQEVDSLESTAKSRNLKIKYRAPSRMPVLYIDEGKVRQVIMNFLDNAIYYSREHTAITVKLSVEAGEVLLEVHDTGIGVPEAEQARLFGKFFRATNARKQRPDGTGVGLYLAKRVITAHGGTMVFSSTEGEGSVFGFRLPIKKLLEAPASDADELNN